MLLLLLLSRVPVPFNLFCRLLDLDASVRHMGQATLDIAALRGVEIRTDPHVAVLAGRTRLTPAFLGEWPADGCLGVDLDMWVQTLVLGARRVLKV